VWRPTSFSSNVMLKLDGSAASTYTKLVINGATTGGGALQFTTGGTSRSDIGYDDAGNALGFINRTSGDAMVFYTHNGTSVGERMRLTSAGNVGIGKTAPATKLDVVGTISGSALTLNGTAGMTMRAASTTWSLIPSGANLLLSNNATGTHVTFSGSANTITFNQVVGLDSAVNVTGSANQSAGVAIMTADTAARPVLLLRGVTGQTANLQEWQKTSGVIGASMSQSGWLAVGTANKATAVLDVNTTSAARKGLIIKGSASQTASAMEVQDSSGVAYYTVSGKRIS
jgi:hypothetical protein